MSLKGSFITNDPFFLHCTRIFQETYKMLKQFNIFYINLLENKVFLEISKKNKKKYNKSKSIIEFTYQNIVLNKYTI